MFRTLELSVRALGTWNMVDIYNLTWLRDQAMIILNAVPIFT